MEREFAICNNSSSSAYSANYQPRSSGTNINYFFGGNYSNVHQFKQPLPPPPHHQFHQKFYSQQRQAHLKQQFQYQPNFQSSPYQTQGNFPGYQYSTHHGDDQRHVQHSHYQPPTNVQIPHYQSQENLQRLPFSSQNVQMHQHQLQQQAVQKHNQQFMQNLQKAHHQSQENQMYKTPQYVSSHQHHAGYVPDHPQYSQIQTKPNHPQYSQYQTKYNLRHSFLQQQHNQHHQNTQQEPPQQPLKPTEAAPPSSGDQCEKLFSYPKDHPSPISSKEGFDFWMGWMGPSSHPDLYNKVIKKRKNSDEHDRPAKRAFDHSEDVTNDDIKRFKGDSIDGDGGYYTEPDIDRDTNDFTTTNDRDSNENNDEDEPILLHCDHCKKKTIVYYCSCRKKVYCGQFCQVTDWEVGGHHLHPAHN